MDQWANIAELVLLVAALLLRRLDARTLRTGLTAVHSKQGALVELVRSSLRPPAPRCGECDHEHRQHFDERGHERTGCAARFCRCMHWVDPPSPIEFADDATPTLCGASDSDPQSVGHGDPCVLEAGHAGDHRDANGLWWKGRRS